MKKILLAVAMIALFTSFTTKANEGDAVERTRIFSASYRVTGLLPRHDYVISINGHSGHECNDLLSRIGNLWRPTGEGYCDFASVMSSSDGTLDLQVTQPLPVGVYKIKLLVKDPKNSWNVVWNQDALEFEIVR